MSSRVRCIEARTDKQFCEDPNRVPFILAHEFFDALPIHAFQSVPPSPQSRLPERDSYSSQTVQTPTGPIDLPKSPKPSELHPSTSNPSIPSHNKQWRELLVTATRPSSLTLPASATAKQQTNAQFHLSISPIATPISRLLPSTSPRYSALLSGPNPPGATIEISPEAQTFAASIATRIGGSPKNPRPKPAGAALIIDYGPSETVPTSTLRGIRQHALVSPFSSPGKVDLSADVDFLALVEAALAASEGVEVHGPVEQGVWLQRMGIAERSESAFRASEQQAAKGSVERVEAAQTQLRKAVQRLTERGGGAMGKLYKVLAIVPERGGQRPVGFGGEVRDV